MPNRDLHAEGVKILDRVRETVLPVLDEAPETLPLPDLYALSIAGLGYVLAAIAGQPNTHVDANGAGWYRDLAGRYRRIDTVGGPAGALTLTELLTIHGTFTPPRTAR